MADSSLGFNLIGRDVSASSALAKLGGNANKTGGKIQNMAKMSAKALGTIAVAAATAGVALAFDALKAAEQGKQAQDRLAKVTDSMGLFGKQAEKVTGRLNDLADATARQTGVDDDNILATQTKLMTFKELAKTAGEVGGSFDRATMAAIDLAAAGFGSAETNAVQLGKALQDPVKGIAALGRSGVTFTEQEKSKIKTLVQSGKMLEAQDVVLKAIETQVGGTAAASATATEKMQVGFSQMQEALGAKLLPAFEKLTGWVMEVGFPAFSKFAEKIGKDLGPVIEKMGPILKQFGAYFMKEVYPRLVAFWGYLQDTVIPGLKKAFVPVWEGIVSLFKTVRSAFDENRDSLEKLGAGLKILADFIIKNVWPIIGAILGNAFRILGERIKLVIDIVGNLVEWFTVTLPNAINTVSTFFTNLVDGIKTTFAKVVDFITAPFKLAFNKIAKFWNETLGSMSFSIPGTDISFDVPDIPMLAKGGIVNRPTLAMIGEAGPEAVVPLSRGGGFGGGITINVAGSVIAERDLAVKVRDEIAQLMRRRGLSPSILGV